MGAFDAFSGQAFDMLTSGKARRAFDLSEEKPATLDRYRASGNKYMYSHSPSPITWDWESFVRARRLVEAGVPFVSLQVGLWDHHCADGLPSLFESYRSLLPLYDSCCSSCIRKMPEWSCAHRRENSFRWGTTDCQRNRCHYSLGLRPRPNLSCGMEELC
jgi:hypothetical protein